MTGRAKVLLILFGITLTGAITTGWDPYFSLSYVFGGLLLIGFIWSRLMLRGLILTRTPRSLRGQMTRPFWETFILKNSSRVPKLWVSIEDQTDFPGHQGSSVVVQLGSKHERSWLARTLCVRRGRFHLGPTILSSSDPFGLFPVRRLYLDPQSVVVLPMTVPLTGFMIPSGIMPGGEAIRKPTHQTTPNATGIRDYVPGDSLNRIHWRSSAKHMRLIAKEFELDPLTDVWIALDGDRECQYGEFDPVDQDIRSIMPGVIKLPPTTEEYMVAAAASIAFHILDQDRAVGFIAHGAARHVIQSDRGEAQLIQILESLAVFEARSELGVGEVLKVESDRIHRGSSVVLITASTGTGILSICRDLSRRGYHPVVVLINALSFGGPEGSEGLAEKLQRDGISTKMMSCGQNLGQALSGQESSRKYFRAA